MTQPGEGGRRLLALADREKLEAVVPRLLDPSQFLSDYGLRSLSRALAAEPYVFDGSRVEYEPGESSSPIYGGNSNWRGPIWLPVNYLMVQALREHHRYYGSSLTVEMPRWSSEHVTLDRASDEIASRLVRLFLRGPDGRRPALGNVPLFQSDPHWRDLTLFYEYFHGENGTGLGASHQTGWTALVAELITQCAGGSAWDGAGGWTSLSPNAVCTRPPRAR